MYPNHIIMAKRSKWRGRYARIRDIYFKERSPLRERELESLLNDVEYLIFEIKRIEQRSRIPGLVGCGLRNLYMKLTYWEKRKSAKSDHEVLQYLAQTNCCHIVLARITVFDQLADSYWFLTETEGGQEIDLYVPPSSEIYEPPSPKEMKILNKQYEDIGKKELWEFVKKLLKEIERLRK